MNRLEQMVEFVRLTDMATRIQASGANPEVIYHTIFSDLVSGAISNMNMKPTYYDPNSSCREDVLAYVAALEETAVEYRKVIKAAFNTGG